MDMIKVKIDGIEVEVPAGTTALEAARKAGIIPTLCYLKDINEIIACRMCLVEVEGAETFRLLCIPCCEQDDIKTNTPKVRAARKLSLEHTVKS